MKTTMPTFLPIFLCWCAAVLLLVVPTLIDGFSTIHHSHHAIHRQMQPASSATSLYSSSTATTSDSDTTTSPDATTATTTTTTTSKGLLKRDRYVATNRFAVRPGREAKFEQRWVTRKSRLATLDGFRYFHLMRRVSFNDSASADSDAAVSAGASYDGGNDKESKQGNYVSFTIWEKKSDFSAWRNGEAFKEAHGGTSIGAFLSTMVNSALVLEGAPRPAFYDGLLVQSTVPETIPKTVDGWRDIVIDKDSPAILPAECFIACNQFYIPAENAMAFEERWSNRESKLKDCPGFVAFSMLRRDGQQKGHGTVPMTDGEPTYMSTTVWKDRASFEAWKNGPAFSQAHGQPAQQQPASATTTATTPPPSPSKPLWSRPPQPIFYEGTLVITSDQGA